MAFLKKSAQSSLPATERIMIVHFFLLIAGEAIRPITF